MTKGAIYYTDSELDPVIMKACQKQLKNAFGGEIISVSLKPMDFGENIVLKQKGKILKRSYPTMVKQILTALEVSSADVVFFSEHDVLYHPSHFDFTPDRNDTFYYNTNDWRWDYPHDRAITSDSLTSRSMLCCNRALALKHYRTRLDTIIMKKLDEHEGREPDWARRWGYEPGTKRTKRGGFSNDKSEYWKSKYPNIDIRHSKTFSRRKVHLDDFKHAPNEETWREVKLDEILGWQNVKELFK